MFTTVRSGWIGCRDFRRFGLRYLASSKVTPDPWRKHVCGQQLGTLKEWRRDAEFDSRFAL